MSSAGTPMSEPVRAVIAGHGSFAAGMISAVEQITGRGAAFWGISNAGRSLEDIQATLLRALDDTGARVVFTDLPAGSCTMVVRRLLRERPELSLVTGVNLPTLLDFAMQELPPVATVAPEEERAARHRVLATALEKGRTALAHVGS